MRALLLLLSLTPPPLFSAPLLAPTDAAFTDSRTKGNSGQGRTQQLEEGQNLSGRSSSAVGYVEMLPLSRGWKKAVVAVETVE